VHSKTRNRFEKIKEFLLRAGKHHPEATIKALAEKFGISESMMRRNINYLRYIDGSVVYKEGWVELVAAPTATDPAPGSQERETAPSAIEAMAQLIQDDWAVILDGGAVSNQIAEMLSKKDAHATIFTNSLTVAITLSKHPKVRVRMIGSEVSGDVLMPIRGGVDGILGISRPNLCVLGPCHLDPEEVTTSDLDLAMLRHEMISNALQVALPITNARLGKKSTYQVDTLEKITYIIPDKSVPNEELIRYEDLGIKVIRG
jgi:DeoR/GlpR family transcriptional regulator of sugar metabolism